jgi:hypothetical protein
MKTVVWRETEREARHFAKLPPSVRLPSALARTQIIIREQKS